MTRAKGAHAGDRWKTKERKTKERKPRTEKKKWRKKKGSTIIGLYSRSLRIVLCEYSLPEVPEPFILHRRIIHIIPPVVIIRSAGYLSQSCHEHRSFVHGDSISPRRNRRTHVYETVRQRAGVDLERQKWNFSLIVQLFKTKRGKDSIYGSLSHLSVSMYVCMCLVIHFYENHVDHFHSGSFVSGLVRLRRLKPCTHTAFTNFSRTKGFVEIDDFDEGTSQA